MWTTSLTISTRRWRQSEKPAVGADLSRRILTSYNSGPCPSYRRIATIPTLAFTQSMFLFAIRNEACGSTWINLDSTSPLTCAFNTGQRCVGVAPPHGTAVLTLIAPEPDSDEYKLIGRASPVAFVSEDVVATYSQWRKRGVRFRHVPRLRRVKYQRKAGDLPERRSLVVAGQAESGLGWSVYPLRGYRQEFLYLW